MWKRVKTLFVYRNCFFLLQIQENIFFSRESPTNLRIRYRPSDFFFFFFRTQKKEKNLENFEHIWGFFSSYVKLSEKKKYFRRNFFPLHALNWNFEMKWKKVSHKKKKTFSHFRKKKLLCRQKVMVMVFTHEKTIRLCDRIPGSALCVSTLWPLALLGSWVSGPWVVALGRGVTADSRVLLADAIVLASMPTPEKRRKISTRSL